MSFKLVGDQYRELNLVQKRRVAELLVNNIPEEEALLMKNGRYACLVCRHRPIFDTIAMLSVHRTGQRHIRAAHLVLQRKQKDREELEKRDQLKQLNKRVQEMSSHGGEDTSPPPLLAQTQAATSSALLPGAPYSSLSKSVHKEMSRAGQGDKQQPFFTRKRQLMATEEDKGSSTKKKICADRSGNPSSSHVEKYPSQDEASPQYVFPWNTETKRAITGDQTSSRKPTDDEKLLAKSEKMKLIQLHSSGWIKNVDGSWSKDPTVEFDSEEDEST